MHETEKYASILYKPNKPYYKMTIQELYDHSRICKSLDKSSCKKIMRMEKWDIEKLEQKKKKFLNNKKKKNKTKRIKIENKTKKEIKKENTKTRRQIQKKRKTRKEIIL